MSAESLGVWSWLRAWWGAVRMGGDGANKFADGTGMHLILYKADGCRWCRRVYAAIDAHGVNVEYRDVRRSRRWRAELHRRTGRRTVPCLFVDGEPMFESADIVNWLDTHFATGREG